LSLAIILLGLPNFCAAFQSPSSPTQEPAKDAQANANVQDDTIECEELRTSLSKLTTQVKRLTTRVAVLEKERLFDVTRVLLVGEEQRAEGLQSRLRENFERMALYQARLDHVENQLKPENIERLFTGVGLVRPEEARDTVRKRLSFEKQAILAQVEHLRQERTRFQSALATADVAIQRLRQRLAQAGRL
jgi:hypothetical protein